ncbi:Ig-like domain-containing protein [Geomonas ferrireducens]|uniref:Ig-like domain-containing protein n=1 Tax=Geomonas ferrireducens TaxID=2570227 RepID=UPI0010A90375|nr:Ig-like domain-containing protein [Geomonas ferrireducens]
MHRLVTRYCSRLLVLSSVLLAGCGGGGSSSSDVPPKEEWAQATSVSSSSTVASISGTAWISDSYYASHCVGLSCLTDTTRTDDYPGVDVTYINQTTGASGTATSYYGPGTDWTHRWFAGVPVVPGTNNIVISAYDPGGKGTTIAVQVVAPQALTVQSTAPASDATGVLLNASISAQFSGEIDPSTTYFIAVTGPGGAVAGTKSVSGSTVTFIPAANLAYDTTYTVTIPTTLRAVSGSSLTSEYTWTFTTMAAPVFRVLSTSPAAGATSVPRDSSVSVTFTGLIDYSTFGRSSFFVSSPTGAKWGYYYSAFGASGSVSDPTLLEANTTYTATLTTAIRDKSGNALPFDYVWSFKTGD